MKHLKDYKWFWVTFLIWFFLGCLGAWALIFSPAPLNQRIISEFTVQINGAIGKNTISRVSGSMNLALERITRDLEEKGWENISGRVNLAPLLLNTAPEYRNILNRLIQLRLFQNRENYKFLGCLDEANQQETYQWISEIPKTAFDSLKPGQSGFPMIPPSTALNVSWIKSKKMESLSWTTKNDPAFQGNFPRFYSAQGFSGKLTSSSNDFRERVYILRRGTDRIVAVLTGENGKFVTSLVKLKGN